MCPLGLLSDSPIILNVKEYYKAMLPDGILHTQPPKGVWNTHIRL